MWLDFLIGLLITVIGGVVVFYIQKLIKSSEHKEKRDEKKVKNKKQNVPKVNANQKEFTIKKYPKDIDLRKDIEKNDKITPKNNPRVIIDLVRKEAPYLRDKKEESFKGLEVQWKLYFNSISKGLSSNPEELLIHLIWKNSFPWITCFVNPEQFPEIRFLEEGSIVTVKGVIEKVNGHNIELTDVRLKIEE